MGFLHQMQAQGVGLRREDELSLSSVNHFTPKSVTASLSREIKSRNLQRVAGNIFICRSKRDLWSVRDGKLLRLTTVEVDNGETAAAADTNDPAAFLRAALSDLTF